MKIKTFISTLFFSGILLSAAAVGLNNNNTVVKTNAWSGNQTSTAGNYYDSVDHLTGASLKSGLQTLLKQNISTSYDWSRYEAADEMEGDSTSILCVYTRTPKKKTAHVGGYSWSTWNREHIYTQSAFPASKSDNHNIFASEGQINNYRGSLKFSDVENSSTNRVTVHGHTTDAYKTSTYFEPPDAAKGEVARAVMYTSVVYGYDLTDIFSSEQLVFDWHEQFPVSDRDIYRNNTVYTLQKNRNPFVDHPEWASSVWGYESTTNYSVSTIDDFDLAVGEIKNIDAKTVNFTASISYGSSNEDVASVDSLGNVEGKQQGKTTITASAIYEGNTYKSSIEVNVIDPNLVSSVNVSTLKSSIKVGEETIVTASVSPSTAPQGVIFKSSNENIATVDQNGNVLGKAVGDVDITAQSTSNSSKQDFVSISVKSSAPSGGGTGSFNKITTLSEIEAGATYALGYYSNDSINLMSNTLNSTYFERQELTLSSTNSNNTNDDWFDLSDQNNITISDVSFTFESVTGGYNIKDSSGKFITSSGEKKVSLSTTVEVWEVISNADFSFSISDDTATLQYNSGAPRFTTYNSNQKKINLYKAVTEQAVDLDAVVAYILAENEENQCQTRFYIAKEMLLLLTNDEISMFKTSSELDITKARERYEAWAVSLHEMPYEYATSLFYNGDQYNNYMFVGVVLISMLVISGSLIIVKTRKRRR